MPSALAASPLIDGSDLTLFIPGPLAFPPLDPVGSVIANLSESQVIVIGGTYPGSDNYPGADHYPGKGTDLNPGSVTPHALTANPA